MIDGSVFAELHGKHLNDVLKLIKYEKLCLDLNLTIACEEICFFTLTVFCELRIV